MVVSTVTGPWTAKPRPWTAATVPLTVTPASGPPVSTVPRTSSRPAGTVAPPAGDVMMTRKLLTVKLCCAVALSLVARSRAFTSKRWVPGPSVVSVAVVSVENPDHGPLSRRHANWRLASRVRLSAPVNVSVAVVACAGPPGPFVICAVGGVLSTMTTRAVVALLPARSVAVALSVCAPSGRLVVVMAAAAVTDQAGGGGGGMRIADRAWLSTLRPNPVTPPAVSAARPPPAPRRRTWGVAGGAAELPGGAWRAGAPAPHAPESH